MRRKAGEEKGREGMRNIKMRGGGVCMGDIARGQKAHGKRKQEQESNRMHERRDTTAVQLQEKDKRCAVKCQGYLIH